MRRVNRSGTKYARQGMERHERLKEKNQKGRYQSCQIEHKRYSQITHFEDNSETPSGINQALFVHQPQRFGTEKHHSTKLNIASNLLQHSHRSFS